MRVSNQFKEFCSLEIQDRGYFTYTGQLYGGFGFLINCY